MNSLTDLVNSEQKQSVEHRRYIANGSMTLSELQAMIDKLNVEHPNQTSEMYFNLGIDTYISIYKEETDEQFEKRLAKLREEMKREVAATRKKLEKEIARLEKLLEEKS
jgi:DNA-binding transcriptional MerR regulator